MSRSRPRRRLTNKRTVTTIDVTPAEVERLAALVGLRVPPEDLEPLARSLAAHAELVNPLLARDLSDVDSVLRFDPDGDA